MHGTPIRVLLVDGSSVALAVLKKLLATSPDIHVVGTAKNGKEALALIPVVNPTVVCTDFEMPVMNGLELTKAIMANCPLPVLVVSALVQKENGSTVFQLMEAGAVDVLPKPCGGDQDNSSINLAELISKIKLLSTVIPLRGLVRHVDGCTPTIWKARARNPIRVVAIGASVGGPRALDAVLRSFPRTLPVPILCVQHIGAGFLQGLMDWLGRSSQLELRIAEHGELPEPGTVYFPQEGTHLVVDRAGRLASSSEPAVDRHRPSITVMFESVATYYRQAASGVLLTGMGKDGAKGLKAISDAGGLTIAQDEQTSVVFGMPQQAIEIGAARCVLPVDRIAETLMAEIFRNWNSR